MSKNLTRKGLALGAVLALGSSLFAGTAAFAAPGITVAADLGTSTNFISGEHFALKVYGNSEFTTSFSNLNWEVKNTSGTAVSLDTNDSTTGWDTATSSTAATATVTPSSGNIKSTAGGNKLGLKIAADKEASFAVTPYIELDGTAGRTSGDLSGNSVTVSFTKVANLTTSIAITAPFEGDATTGSSFTVTGINNEQLTGSDFGVKYTYGDDSALTGASSTAIAAGAIDSTDKVFKTVTTGSITSGLAKGKAVKAQVWYKDGGVDFSTGAKVGSAVTAAVTARAIDTFKASGVASSTLLAGAAASTGATADVAADSAFAVKVVAKDATTPTALAVAGKAVTFKVETNATLSATAGSVVSVTVAGVTYTDAAKFPGATDVAKASAGNTDSTGAASVAVATSGLTAGQYVKVTFYAENFSSDVTATVRAASYTGYIKNAQGDKVVTTDGTGVNLNVVVRDQFGAAIADGYDVIASFTSSSQATTAATSASANHVAIVSGKAVLPIVDNGTGLGTNRYAITFDKRVAAGGFANTPVTIAAAFDIVIASAADAAAGTVTLTATAGGTELSQNTGKTAYVLGSVAGGSTKADLSTADFGSFDGRAVLGTVPTQTVTAPVVYGTVTSKSTTTSASAAIPSAAVTVSGAGLLFQSTQSSQDVYASDSLALVADASGQFSFSVYSHKVGKQLVTITSGAGSSVVEVNFVDSASETAAKTIVIDSVSSTQSGRAIDVTVTLTDKYGNVIDTDGAVAAGITDVLSITTSGPGYSTAAIASSTDAKGQVKFKLILGAGEVDDTTISASFDADGTGTDYTAVAAAKTVTVGNTDASIDIVGKRVTAVASYSKGKTVSFYVDGIKKWSKPSVSDAEIVLNYNLKKGTHTVTVKISGGFVTTEKFIVK